MAAATPIPDEPVVIPLGLMRYNPVKFFSAYFLGKITITVAGTFLGGWIESNFYSVLSQEAMIALSVGLTVAVTVIMFKMDVGKWIDRIFKRTRFNKKVAQ